MDPSGNVHALVPIDLILDTDIGLYRTIASKYRAEDVFKLDICDSDIGTLKEFTVNRISENPLDAITKEINEEVNRDYYEEFMEKERDFILANSPETILYNFILNTINITGINFYIWSKYETDRDFLIKSNRYFCKASFITSDDYLASIKKTYTSVYVKYYKDLIKYANKISEKHVYIANYKFNFDIGDPSVLDTKTSILIADMITYVIFDIYSDNQDDYQEPIMEEDDYYE